jgi:hypothetical protein
LRFDDAARERALTGLRRAAARIERRLVQGVE